MANSDTLPSKATESEDRQPSEINVQKRNQMNQNRYMSFGKTEVDDLMGGGIISGSHYILEFEPGTAEMSFLASYLNQGLKQSEICVLVLYDKPCDYFVEELEELKVPVREALSSGSMLIADFYRSGKYEPDNRGPILSTDDPSNPSSVIRLLQDQGNIIRRELATGKFRGARGVQCSLSGQLMTHKFEATYKLTKAALEISRENFRFDNAFSHSLLFALNCRVADQNTVARFEQLCDGVIVLSVKEVDGRFQRFLRIKQSPLLNFCQDEIPYDIVGNSLSITAPYSCPYPTDCAPGRTMTVGEVNRKIISELQTDGRKTYEELGRIVGLTSNAVKKRIRNLLNQHAMKVVALLNVAGMKMHAAVTMLDVENDEALNHILTRFKDCPRVINMFTTLGGYNVIALTFGEDVDTLQSESLGKCALRSAEGVRRSDFHPIENTNYSAYLQVREYLVNKDRNIAPCSSDCRTCERYHDRRCVACPATKWYRGKL
jgi:Lrp/AsnC family transcriptional regulator for asnA, asnC and gidA